MRLWAWIDRLELIALISVQVYLVIVLLVR